MPQATDVIINNAAAVAKTFTLLSPAGDNSISKWELKEGLNRLAFPAFTALARPTGDKGRKINIKFAFPYAITNTTTGEVTVATTAYAELSTKVPDNFPESLKADFAAFIKNASAHALFNAMLKDAASGT